MVTDFAEHEESRSMTIRLPYNTSVFTEGFMSEHDNLSEKLYNEACRIVASALLCWQLTGRKQTGIY